MNNAGKAFCRAMSLIVTLLLVSGGSFADSSGLDAIEHQYGKAAVERVKAWRDLMLNLSRHRRGDDSYASRSANDFFNQLPWVTDLEHWGQEDYWATPLEMLATNGGDCEDFSIGKYFTLSETGVDVSKIRITYVKALNYNQAHMVLAYYATPDAEPLILDNINKTILPASQRPDLLPIYSFNGDGLWLAKSRKSNLSSSKLIQWKRLNKRVIEEMQQLY